MCVSDSLVAAERAQVSARAVVATWAQGRQERRTRAAAERSAARRGGRALAGLSDDVLARVDVEKTLLLAADTNERVAGLDEALFEAADPDAVVSVVQAGWGVYAFPDCPQVSAVETPHGWGCQPASASFARDWAMSSAVQRREAVRTAMVEQTMVFGSFGIWAQSLMEMSPSLLGSGVWRVVSAVMGENESRAAQFLYSLGGGETLALL